MEPSLSCEDQADPPKSTNGESSAASSSQFATLLEGLRKHYSPDDNPPFATEKPSGDVGYQAGSVQELVLATDDGRYPEAPVQRAQVVYRCWNDRCIFGTVELNGLLHIVTSFGGGVDNGEAGGAAFKHWLGPQDGFSSLPIAFEDIGPMPAAAQNQKASKSVSPSGQASKESARHISRASNQLRRSESGPINIPAVGDAAKEDEPLDSSIMARTWGYTSSSDSSSSSDSEDSLPNLQSPQLTTQVTQNIKVEPSESHSLLTPARSVPRALPNRAQRTPKLRDGLESRLIANGLKPKEVDKTLIQFREQGQTFGEIREYFSETYGVEVHMSTWYNRYKRLRKQQDKYLNTKPLKSGKTLKRTRTIAKPEVSNEYTENATDDDDFQGASAECNFYPPQDGLIKHSTPRQRALAHAKFASRPLSTSREEASEADNLLLHMKDVQYKPWGEIRKAWTAATGQETGESALLDRYNRLKAVLVPTSNPNKRARFSRYDDSVSAPRFQARHQTTRSVSPEPILKSTTSNMPSLALHKLNRTTIRVSHSGSFAPVKLRSCTTISDLFNTVARICDLTQTSRRKTRTSLKATFPWVAKTEEGRTMLLNEGLEDSFEIFLETIDEAPCWETENGKCTVHIEVVYRNISGEPAGEASFGSWPASDKVYA